MNLTQADAEKIAKWLGSNAPKITNVDGEMCAQCDGMLLAVKHWLTSDFGTVAMIRKLEELYIRQEHWPASIAPDSIIYKLTSNSFDWLEYKYVHVMGRAPTLNAALQDAILKMLEVIENG